MSSAILAREKQATRSKKNIMPDTKSARSFTKDPFIQKKGTFMIEYSLYIMGGFLVAAALAGLALLKAHEEFRKGIEKKSKFHLWSAFFIVSILFMTVTFVLIKVTE